MCEFAVAGPVRDRLVAAVLGGVKTATASLLAQWEQDDEPLSVVGERQAVLDSLGQAVAMIELVAVDVVRLCEVDQRVAGDEGEGFASVAEWRAGHERFWTEHVLPGLAGTDQLNDDTMVVVERFRLVEQGGRRSTTRTSRRRDDSLPR